MGFEPGGRSDKLGNRYEGRWTAKQLLRLLNEEIRSVTLEAVGDDEKGGDLWIELHSGSKEAHQCKARNRSKEVWDICDLKNRGVLKHLRFQLDRKPDHEFVFVSGVPATLLGDICNSARNSNYDPEAFYKFQVEGVSQSRLQLYREFCKALDIDADDLNGRSIAYDYLRRTRIVLYPDDKNTRDDLLTWSGFLLTGEPETVLATMLAYVENHDRFGVPIYPDDLLKYLENQEIYPKNPVFFTSCSLS